MIKTEQIIDTFYKSFAKRDYKTMQNLYHEQAVFSDPVFTNLEGNQVKAMWHMLCESAKDLTISHGTIGTFDNNARVTWKAAYTFSKTNRMVHNVIDAHFYFKDGLIIQHYDDFDFYKWTRMALGTRGLLFGWTQFVQDKIRHEANLNLKKFIKNHSEYL